MNVLMISGDKNILTQGSEANVRFQLQKSQVDQLDVFIWPQIHSFKDILRAAAATRYDVITAQDPFWRGLLAWRTARKTGAKLNLQVHANLTAQSLVKRIHARFTLRRADSIRVVSNVLAAHVHALGAKGKISILPIFIDVSEYQTITPQPHIRKTILWMGRFENEKDPVAAIRTLREVRARGVDATLIMLGSGRLEPTLKRFARSLPITFPGWQDPKPYLAVADVVLSTSREESYGASIIEALAAGVPVVAPDVGIAKEAGAIVVPKSDFGGAVVKVLGSGERGELKIPLLNADEWAKRWKETLV